MDIGCSVSDALSLSDRCPHESVLLLTFVLCMRTALLHGQIGRRIFRQRLETGDKETALEERKVGGCGGRGMKAGRYLKGEKEGILLEEKRKVGGQPEEGREEFLVRQREG